MRSTGESCFYNGAARGRDFLSIHKIMPDEMRLCTQEEALRVMVVVQLLSTYDPDEEFLGVRSDGWSSH